MVLLSEEIVFEALFQSKPITNKAKIINMIIRLIPVTLLIHTPPKRLKCFVYLIYLKNFAFKRGNVL